MCVCVRVCACMCVCVCVCAWILDEHFKGKVMSILRAR